MSAYNRVSKFSLEQHAGGQSIHRAVTLLSIVAERRGEGVRLIHIAETAKLHIATARRILQVLVAEGFLSFDKEKKLYLIGPAIFSFAVLGSPWYSRYQAFLPTLEQIAEETGDTVIFSIRSGNESVCLGRTEGSYPIRVLTLEAGSRRPLGAGSGSLAILAFLSEDERRTVIEQNAEDYKRYKLAVRDVERMVDISRKAGFSFNDGRIVEGVFGLGVPILSHAGDPLAAVSVAAIESRMTKERRLEIVSVIRKAMLSIPGVLLPEQIMAPTLTGRRKRA